MNYLRKHWEGKLPLSVSFWVNLVLVNVIILVFTEWFATTDLIENPVLYARVFLTLIVFNLFILYVWQIVGVWRSADNYAKEKNSTKIRTLVRAVLIIGVLGTIGSLGQYSSEYRYFVEIGFSKDPLANYDLSLSRDKTKIIFEGGMGFGASADFENYLKDNPTVNGVILNSIGGRLYEARQISNIILKNGLNTFSTTVCLSACTIAFLSGTKRIIGEGSTFGFHRSSMDLETSYAPTIIDEQEEIDRQDFLNKEVDPNFVEKAFRPENDDMWYPSYQEMLDANFATEILPSSEILAGTPLDVSKDQVRIILQQFSIFKTIKKYRPDLENQIMHELETLARKGASALEIQNASSSLFMILVNQQLWKANDSVLVHFTRVLVNALRKLNTNEPILCMKYLYPDVYGSFLMGDYFTLDELNEANSAMNDVLISSFESPGETDEVVAIEEGAKILNSVNTEILWVDLNLLSGNSDYARYCDEVILFYSNILELDEDKAGNLLRFVFNPENN